MRRTQSLKLSASNYSKKISVCGRNFRRCADRITDIAPSFRGIDSIRLYIILPRCTKMSREKIKKTLLGQIPAYDEVLLAEGHAEFENVALFTVRGEVGEHLDGVFARVDLAARLAG